MFYRLQGIKSLPESCHQQREKHFSVFAVRFAIEGEDVSCYPFCVFINFIKAKQTSGAYIKEQEIPFRMVVFSTLQLIYNFLKRIQQGLYAFAFQLEKNPERRAVGRQAEIRPQDF